MTEGFYPMFELPKSFVDAYRQIPVEFGWNGLGEVAFYRTYSRRDNPKTNGALEGWADVCERSVNGMYTFQQEWCRNQGVNWNSEKAQRSAEQAFKGMFNLHWSPPGRGLWMGGTDFVLQRGVVEALQNCAFISSEYISTERGSFFSWLMEMSMLGIGVGFDTRGANKLTIREPSGPIRTFVVEDTRESWAKSVEVLVNSYLDGSYPLHFDYSLIRPKGSLISGFGGVASGPKPLMELHTTIINILDNKLWQPLDSRVIVDLCNLIGKCVVSGNVRRSALISFGSPTDTQFINLKNYTLNPERADYGWVSNNSIFADVGMDYTDVATRTYENGEPGYYWLENARKYGRMDGTFDYKDSGVMGGNPCMEQNLDHKELCTLCEIYLPRCKTKQEFEQAIKYAYLYGKSITLASHRIKDPVSREVMKKNRRIGLSVTGITQFLGMHGMDTLRDWLDHGHHLTGYYDRLYSQWLGVNESIRRNSVKPSGTVSLLAGVTPGVHFNVADRFHIRRMIIADDSPLIDPLQKAGYPMEESAYTPGSLSVSFPVDAGKGVRSENDVSMKEQLDLISMVQKHWADNAVSATVKFDRERVTALDIKKALEKYQYHLKGVSFLPMEGHGYVQAPYESISSQEYARLMEGIQPFSVSSIGGSDKQVDQFCDGAACAVPNL